MRIKLRLDLNVPKNAGLYYSKSKEIEKKIDGARKAIEETKRKIKEHKELKSKEKQKIRVEKKWYEKFHYFFTESGNLVIGGRDGTQNEILFKKHIEDNDLIYHADIMGASLVVFKNGLGADLREKLEVAQFAVSFSRAWNQGYTTTDVYCVKKDQISKTPKSGEYIKKGSFIITGEREWFKNTELKLKIGIVRKKIDEKKKTENEGNEENDKMDLDSKTNLNEINEKLIPLVYPYRSTIKLEKYLVLKPGGHFKKMRAAKSIAKYLSVDTEEIIPLLPNGQIGIKKE